MTAEIKAELTAKGHPLRVTPVEEGNFYVESSEGKIAYKVRINGGKPICTCADFTSNKAEQCKHILAVLNADLRSDNGKPKLDDRFKMEISGKEFVLYAGLLDLAHQLGIEKIEVEAVQFPTKENGSEAICKAMVETKKGEVFVEWGDANPNNTNKKITPHILRMAATRAKARALRDYTNIGMTCLEELGDLDDVVTEKKPSTRKTTSKSESTGAQKSAPGETSPKQEPQKSSNEPVTFPKPSEAQMKAIQNLAQRRGVSPEELEKLAQQQFKTPLHNLTSNEASGFIRYLQQAA